MNEHHTPGPWIALGFINGTINILAKGSTGVAKIWINEPSTKANAALVAASPDLLRALKLLVADVDGYEAWQRPCHALDVAIAAIAKAEGR